MSKDILFNHTTIQDVNTLSDYLDAVREGFRQGSLSLQDKNKELVLEPQGLVNFQITAKRTDNHCKLTLTFAWQEGIDETEDNELRIKSG